MISFDFDFENGVPFGPQLSASIDDEDYVEYPLDNLAGFPRNVAEEERMLMEAVLESLKDMEVRKSSVEEPLLSNVDNGLPDPSNKSQEDSSSTTKPATPEVESAIILAANDHDSTPEDLRPSSSKSSVETSSSTVSSDGGAERKEGASPLNDSSASTQSSTDNDAVDHSKSTITVVKSPTSNIMDVLLRRWDLKLF